MDRKFSDVAIAAVALAASYHVRVVRDEAQFLAPHAADSDMCQFHQDHKNGAQLGPRDRLTESIGHRSHTTRRAARHRAVPFRREHRCSRNAWRSISLSYPGTPCPCRYALFNAACTILLLLMRQYPLQLRVASFTCVGFAPSLIRFRRLVRGCFHCFQ